MAHKSKSGAWIEYLVYADGVRMGGHWDKKENAVNFAKGFEQKGYPVEVQRRTHGGTADMPYKRVTVYGNKSTVVMPPGTSKG